MVDAWLETLKAAAFPLRLRMPDRIGMVAAGFTFALLSRGDPDAGPFFAGGLCLAATGALLVVTGIGKRP